MYTGPIIAVKYFCPECENETIHWIDDDKGYCDNTHRCVFDNHEMFKDLIREPTREDLGLNTSTDD